MKIQKEEKENTIKHLEQKIPVKLEKSLDELETELRDFDQILEGHVTMCKQVCLTYYMNLLTNLYFSNTVTKSLHFRAHLT